MFRKPTVLGIILLFILTSVIPMVSSDSSNINKTIYVDDENIFYDYNDDVFCTYYKTIFNKGEKRNYEKQNVNIISGRYSRTDDNVSLTLEVEGIIEDKGHLIISDFNLVDTVFYSFNLNTSKNTYIINYCNRSCILGYDTSTQNLTSFVVDGSNLSVTFSLNDTSETFYSLGLASLDFSFVLGTRKYELNIDMATNIEYSMDINITKPDNSLYVFNREILPLSSPIIIGKIDIEIEELLKDTFIFHSELYIDSELINTHRIFPDVISWNKLSFDKHTMKVIAYDPYGNRASDEMTVWKFF